MDEDDRVIEGASPIRVLLVEDHRLVREGLRLLLEREPDLAVAGEAADGEAGLRLFARLVVDAAVDVVVTDIGLPGLDGLEVARRAKAANIPVYTIALGTDTGEVVQQDAFGFVQRIPVPPDKATLRDIARDTGGRFFEAVSSDDAEDIYSKIGTRLTSKPEQREVTVAFAGGALVLLLIGGMFSLGWFGRLPA